MVKLNAPVDEQGFTRCCEQIETLAQQLAIAMDAIAHHQLTTFEKSLEAQQHCLAKLLLVSNWIKEVNRNSVSSQMYIRLLASVQKLVQLNKQYSALLEHTSRSLHMLQALDPRFALTAACSTMKLSLAGSVGKDFAMHPTLSWHG